MHLRETFPKLLLRACGFFVSGLVTVTLWLWVGILLPTMNAEQRMAMAKKEQIWTRENHRWAQAILMLGASENYATETLSPRCAAKVKKALKAVKEAKRVYCRESSAMKYKQKTETELKDKEREVQIANDIFDSEMVPSTQGSAGSGDERAEQLLALPAWA